MIHTRMETFLTLCRLMNYRKTAEALNMTQPAVTQHIHYLEEYYGCKLFLYDRRSLKMTKEAELLKRYAENVIYQEKKLRARLHEGEGRHLAIGATKTIGEYIIAEHVGRFLKDPNHSISVTVDNTEQLLGALSKGEIDFALIEGFFDRGKYASRLYRKEPFVGICGKEHPFAGRTLSLNEIRKETMILREKGSGTRNILQQLLAGQNDSLSGFERMVTINSFALMMQLIEKGEGITFAYRAVKDRHPNLAEFQVDVWDVVREFNYVYLDTPFSEEAVNEFDSYKSIIRLQSDADGGMMI